MTPRQRDVFDYIRNYWDDNRCSPSYQNIMDGLGIKSKANIHSILHALQERGWIIYTPRRARSIVLNDLEGRPQPPSHPSV